VAVLGEAALGARVPGGREGLRQVGFIKLELLSQRGCAIKTYGGTQGVNGEGGAACVSCAHDSQDVRTSTHEGSGADSAAGAAGAAADPSMLRLTFFEFTIANWPCCDKERFFLTLPFFFGGILKSDAKVAKVAKSDRYYGMFRESVLRCPRASGIEPPR